MMDNANSMTEFIFFAIASRVMRQVLVDYARARATSKRSGEKIEDESGEMAEASLQVAGKGIKPVKILELNESSRGF